MGLQFMAMKGLVFWAYVRLGGVWYVMGECVASKGHRLSLGSMQAAQRLLADPCNVV
jgi:hypothetical protein